MPKFWTGMGRFLAGKPVFDQNDLQQNLDSHHGESESGQVQTSESKPYSPIVKGDPRTFPVLEIRRIDNRFNGSNMSVSLRIYNPTSMQIWLERIQVFGTSKRISDDLRPRQEDQYSVYSGPVMRNDHNHMAKLVFKTMDGDYFDAEYVIRYHFRQELNCYEAVEMHQHGQVRDIYEGGLF